MKKIPGTFIDDISGNKYGNLTVLSFEGRNKRKKAQWLCKCDCGKTKICLGESLKKGNTKTCGCSHRYEDNTSTINGLYNNYRTSARTRNYKFELTKEQFKDIISRNCYYCDMEPKQLHKPRGYYRDLFYNGIDRYDNKIGYTIDNSVACCKLCNNMKHTLSNEAFLTHIERIFQCQNQKVEKMLSEKRKNLGFP